MLPRLLFSLFITTMSMYFLVACMPDPCDPNPCENGGTCIANSTVAECTCLDGYTGANCELESAGCIDEDNDGYGDPASTDCIYQELDCDDSNPDIYPNATELCDGFDNQCPGDVGYSDVDEGC